MVTFPSGTEAPLLQVPAPRRTHVRWWICGLLFLGTTICYLDRNTVSVLADTLKKDMGLGDAEYGWINFSFATAYALMYSVAGRIMDLVGVRIGLAVAVFFWSLAAMAHAFARGPISFCIVRFLLGIGEAANFPASIKTVAEYFPRRERAFATGIFNAGSNVGIMLSFITVAIAAAWHWQLAFLVTGVLGLFWVALWWMQYRPLAENPKVSAAERAHIEGGREAPAGGASVSWTILLRHREAWPYFIAKFMTDPVWWFYLYWLPSYLKEQRQFSLTGSAVALIVPYIIADIGSIFGGWLSGHLVQRGWSLAPARYAAMALCAACMPAGLIAVYTQNNTAALVLISLALAGHQGWSANIYTSATDMFPTRLAGSITGLGGTFGAIGGMFMPLAVGVTLQWLGGDAATAPYRYVPIFIWASLMHPLALVIYFVFLGRKFPEVAIGGAGGARRSAALLVSGAVTGIAGVVGLVTVVLKFSQIVAWTTPAGRAANPSAAAAAVTIGAFVALLGGALIYAGLPKRGRLKLSQK